MNWLDFLTRRTPNVAAPALSVPALRSRLVESVTWLAPANERPTVEEVGTFLQTRPPQTLLDIDERARSWACPFHRDWPVDMVGQLSSSDLDPLLRQPLMFLCASHHDGHVREAAVYALADHPGYLTLAAALVRCADWVGQVRHAAETVSVRLLDGTEGHDVVALWPLVLRLRTRERVSQPWFTARVEGWMLQPASRHWLRELLASRHAPSRAWAFRQCLECDIDPGFDVLARAIGDPDPRIGLHALRHAAQHDVDRARSTAESGLCAAHPVLRRESLLILSAMDGAVTQAQLRDLSCDASGGVRSLATYLLRERYSEDAATTWRLALDMAGTSVPLEALNALADHAQPQDAHRFRRWLSEPSSVTRSSALRGLMKAGAVPDDPELASLIFQGGNRVRWLLHRHVRRGDIALDSSRLVRLLNNDTATDQARDDIRELVLSLGHWPSLTLLLQFLPGDHTALRAWWHEAIVAWVAVSERYAPLGQQTRERLLLALESRQRELSPRDCMTVRSAIERH